MDLYDFIRPQLLRILDVATRAEAISQLSTFMVEGAFVGAKLGLEEAILHREKLLSTGIGFGIAIPHARLPNCPDFYIAVGVTRHDIDWRAIDGEPVRLIAMIAGPHDRQREYLQLLSQLTFFLRDEQHRKRLLAASSPLELHQVFERPLATNLLT